jgi:hypothetical protein
MRRVLRTQGKVLIIDLLGDEQALVDTHLQSWELLRDTSHVRDRSSGEWHSLLQAAGFTRLQQQTWPTRLEFGSWIERMRTPETLVSAIRALQRGAPLEVQRALSLESDGSFTAHTGLFWGEAQE